MSSCRTFVLPCTSAKGIYFHRDARRVPRTPMHGELTVRGNEYWRSHIRR